MSNTSNFKIIWKLGVKEKFTTNETITPIGDTHLFSRVLMFPTQNLAAAVAEAMIGEEVYLTNWFHLMHVLSPESPILAALKKDAQYGVVLNEVSSIKETQDDLTLGPCGHCGIPNDQYIWDLHVVNKLRWSWSDGKIPVWTKQRKDYTRTERVTLNGHELPQKTSELKHLHRVGIVFLYTGSWPSQETAFEEIEKIFKVIKGGLPAPPGIIYDPTDAEYAQ